MIKGYRRAKYDLIHISDSAHRGKTLIADEGFFQYMIGVSTGATRPYTNHGKFYIPLPQRLYKSKLINYEVKKISNDK